jgi:GAF domain-containing protein
VLVRPDDPLFQLNPLLPKTRIELVVPLQAGGQIIGVLDVQSADDDAFAPDDVAGLQALANQLATTIERIRLLEELQARLAENEHLLAENQTRLAEVEELNLRLTGQAWASYLSGRGTDTLGYDWTEGELKSERSWTPGLVATVSASEASLRQEGERQVLSVPITLRDGSALGAIELSADHLIWDQHSKELVQEVANRLSVSLESARLFEGSQRLANRERLMNEVSAEFQSRPDISGLLSTAAAEIRQALSAHTVTVQLSLSNDQQPENGSGD